MIQSQNTVVNYQWPHERKRRYNPTVQILGDGECVNFDGDEPQNEDEEKLLEAAKDKAWADLAASKGEPAPTTRPDYKPKVYIFNGRGRASSPLPRTHKEYEILQTAIYEAELVDRVQRSATEARHHEIQKGSELMRSLARAPAARENPQKAAGDIISRLEHANDHLQYISRQYDHAKDELRKECWVLEKKFDAAMALMADFKEQARIATEGLDAMREQIREEERAKLQREADIAANKVDPDTCVPCNTTYEGGQWNRDLHVRRFAKHAGDEGEAHRVFAEKQGIPLDKPKTTPRATPKTARKRSQLESMKTAIYGSHARKGSQKGTKKTKH